MKDIDLLEGVQRRATKLINEVKSNNYADRLLRLKLTTLETRRLRGDLIETFKIMQGLTDLDKNEFFETSKNVLRGHCFKIHKPRVFTDVGKYSYSFRVISYWNKLPTEIVNSTSLNSFKNKVDLLFKQEWGFT